MDTKNYTPINPSELEKKTGQTGKAKSGVKMNTILLLIGTITAIVLAVMLFVLIQKKMQSQQSAPPALEKIPTATSVPTVKATPTIPIIETPAPTVSDTAVSPTATVSAAPLSSPSAALSPATTATPSATRMP